MKTEFLLTYVKNDATDYAFFDTEEELREYVESESSVKVMGAIEFTHVRDIEIEGRMY